MRENADMGIGLTRVEYFVKWSQLHGNIEPRGLVRVWLTVAHVLARPFMRLSPNAISILTVVVAALVTTQVRDGSRSLVLYACLVLLIGMLDSLDGVVAICTNRVTRWGAVLDSVADRIVDFFLVVMLVRIGAPAAVASVALTLTFVLEYMRARAQGLGVHEFKMVTAGEKPTRVAIVTMFLFACAALPDYWTLLSDMAIWTWLTVSGISVAQLMCEYKRLLSAPDVRGNNLG